LRLYDSNTETTFSQDFQSFKERWEFQIILLRKYSFNRIVTSVDRKQKTYHKQGSVGKADGKQPRDRRFEALRHILNRCKQFQVA